MAESIATEAPTGTRRPWWKALLLKAAILVGLGLLMGAAYDWVAPRMYGPERVPGFRLGVLHGALMPIALPALLMGRDVPIYAATNTGRIYKVGYIAGINLCGMLFFGAAFRKPRGR
jgi:hypothetical protein